MGLFNENIIVIIFYVAVIGGLIIIFTTLHSFYSEVEEIESECAEQLHRESAYYERLSHNKINCCYTNEFIIDGKWVEEQFCEAKVD